MDYIVPKNNYLVVLPDGRGIGFVDLEEAEAYVSIYCEERIDAEANLGAYSSYDMYEEKAREDVAQIVGCEEGEGKIYNIDDIIENVQTMEDIFEDEKEEIIKNLISDDCKFDIYSLGIESILINVDPIISNLK